MINPKLPDYTHATWTQADFPTQVKMVCQSWAKDGYGTPLSIHLFYALKMLFFAAGWFFFCLQDPSFSVENISVWWASPDAFIKAILWALLFEGLGLGCGSGPLTARYVPPFGGFLYFLRPSTLKLPLFPNAPIIGHFKRGWVDILVYLILVGWLVRTLLSVQIETTDILCIGLLVVASGVLDKTLFLVHRSEHYLSILFCWLFAQDALAASKGVWLFLWFGAGLSKLNHHFPSVVGVMISNAPWTAFGPVRKLMYRDYPDDLQPSKVAMVAAAMGTALELGIPLVLIFASGGSLTVLGIAMMLGLHLFIMSTMPMGVPLEWNIVMIYGGLVLFGVHSEVLVHSISSPWIWAWLILFHGGCVVVGNLYPHRVSFLLAHRYYAGNWAYSVWLFRGESLNKLGKHLTMSSTLPEKQLGLLYSTATIDLLLSKVIAFRMMHILGRALRALVPLAVEDVKQYRWLDGELIAGLALGWNFGDGHLSELQLLDIIQQECQFEDGELRHIFVESQPLHQGYANWVISDAATGVLHRGSISIQQLRTGQPWDILTDPEQIRTAVSFEQ